MIIEHLKAENILKYSNLEIKNLPVKGLIGIQGPNESGKTSIGEIICFSLYGRTYSLEKDETEKIIKWDEPRGMVQMDFSVNRERLRIIRYLDDEGNHGARLIKLEKEEVLMAKGAEGVNKKIVEISGMDFEEFIESIYLAQRETITSYPHSEVIKKMAGTDKLESVYEEIVQARENQERELAETQKHIRDNEENLENIGYREGKLKELEDSKIEKEERRSQVQENLRRFETALDKYDENWPKIRKLKKQLNRFLLLSILFFLISAAIWASWGFINYAPESDISQNLEAFYSSWVPGWGEYLILLPAAAVVTGILLILIVLETIFYIKKKRRERESKKLADCLKQINEDYTKASSNEDEDSPPQNMDKAVSLAGSINTLEAAPSQVKKPAREVFAYLEWAVRKKEEEISAAEIEIEEEKTRKQRVEEMRSIADDLISREKNQKRKIKIYAVALELLQGAIHNLSKNFNRKVIRLAGKTLPLFTDGRYSHIQIDENFAVKIFSGEKHDFMDFDEASSGTRQQIMLALRLAFSHELVEKIKGKAQFIFLDEPFAFFDENRIRGTLKSLPKFSNEIRQIWIASQDFPQDVSFQFLFPCLQDADELIVDIKDQVQAK